MNRKLLQNLSIIVLLIVAGFLTFLILGKSKSDTTIDIRKFSGGIESVDGDIITMQGIYDGPIGTTPENLSINQSFSFKVDLETSFDRLEIILPTWESLTGTGSTSGTFYFRDLPQTEGEGSLEDIKESLSKGSISAEVDFPSSIYNTKNPVASSIFYTILVQSPPL